MQPDRIFIIRMKHYKESDLNEVNNFLSSHSTYVVKSVTPISQHLYKDGLGGGEYDVIVVVGPMTK